MTYTVSGGALNSAQPTSVDYNLCSFVRLPDRLVVSFPSGDEMKDGDKKPAGTSIGE